MTRGLDSEPLPFREFTHGGKCMGLSRLLQEERREMEHRLIVLELERSSLSFNVAICS